MIEVITIIVGSGDAEILSNSTVDQDKIIVADISDVMFYKDMNEVHLWIANKKHRVPIFCDNSTLIKICKMNIERFFYIYQFNYSTCIRRPNAAIQCQMTIKDRRSRNSC